MAKKGQKGRIPKGYKKPSGKVVSIPELQKLTGGGMTQKLLFGPCFPILIMRGGRPVSCLGSGFQIARFRVATAKHVLEHLPKLEEGEYPVIALMVGHRVIYRPLASFVVHPTADIGLAYTPPTTDEGPVPLEFESKHVLTDALAPGHKITAFGFPQGQYLEGCLRLTPKEASGSIITHYPIMRDRVMMPGPCYETNLSYLGGASGGPVYCTATNKVVGIASTSFDGQSSAFITPISTILGAPIQTQDGKLLSLAQIMVKHEGYRAASIPEPDMSISVMWTPVAAYGSAFAGVQNDPPTGVPISALARTSLANVRLASAIDEMKRLAREPRAPRSAGSEPGSAENPTDGAG